MWRSFARLLTQFDRKKLEPAIAFRNAIGVALPLAIGVLIGMPLGGLAVASGALQVAYSDGHDPYSRRGFRMLLSSLLCSLAVMIGGLAGRNPIVATIAVMLWGFASGFVVLLGPDAESLGVISLVTLIIYAAQSLTIERALNAGLLALGGGLLQTMLSVLLWPIARREPERRAIASLYSELSRSAVAEVQSKEAPPATAEITQAQHALRRLGRNPDNESQRLWSLLNQAERLRLSLLTLGRLRKRASREAERSPEVEISGRFLELAADVLRAIAATLVTHKIPSSSREALRGLQQLADDYRLLERGETSFPAAVRRAIRYQLDSVAGQVRSAFRLASNRVLSEADTAPTEAMPTLEDRLRDDLSTLRANLTLQSAGFRHAIRLSATLVIGEAMAHAISARRSYWLPMTISLVLKPEFTVTFTRGLLRIAGTIAGLLLSTLLFHFLTPAIALEILLVMLFVFLVRWIGPANYGIFAINVSALVVLMIAFTSVAPKDVILARGLMTSLGGITALAAYALWPTWETARTSEVLARMLDAYRRYFRLVAAQYLNSEIASPTEINKARLEARRARSTLETSVDRLRLEPLANADDIKALNAMLASSHRFINATMSLEGGHEKTVLAEAKALDVFCEAVEKTLTMLSNGLRAERPLDRNRPGLRDAHNALLAAVGKERYTVLADETDRIANSLNTLSEQVLAWRKKKKHAGDAIALAPQSS